MVNEKALLCRPAKFSRVEDRKVSWGGLRFTASLRHSNRAPQSKGTNLAADSLLDNSLELGLRLYLGNRPLSSRAFPVGLGGLLPYALYPLRLNP